MPKQIELTQGKFAIVDDEDYEYLSKYKWCFSEYARTKENSKPVLMHRVIINAEKGVQVDHINGDKLDNRKCNLRKATHAENMRNRKVQDNNKSGYRGVHRKKRDKKWYAQIKILGKQIYLGTYDTAEEASRVYEERAVLEYGSFKRA